MVTVVVLILLISEFECARLKRASSKTGYCKGDETHKCWKHKPGIRGKDSDFQQWDKNPNPRYDDMMFTAAQAYYLNLTDAVQEQVENVYKNEN